MAFWGNQDDKKKSAFAAGDSSQASATTTPFPLPRSDSQASVTPSFAPSSEESRVRSALGPGTVIQGKLSFDAPVSIDGKLSGEIYSSKTLIVGKSGVIDAQVEVATLIVKGIVKGHIKASERIEIREGGQLLGDIVTPALMIEEGCIFNGGCSMTNSASLRKVG
jgi:cytoskeletal protein CcmA (bactofilin family)